MNSNFVIAALVFTVTTVAAVVVIRHGNGFLAGDQDGWSRKAALETPGRIASLASAPVRISDWPPVHRHRFPDLDFYDHNGKKFSISALPSRPTLIEFIAMSCAGCQAFAGGNKFGAFQGLASQAELQSIDEYFKQYTGQELSSAEINFVQIVVYDLRLRSPSAQTLADWRKHFQLDRQPNTYVIGGGDGLANKASFAMIPGFMLLDAQHVIQYDSTGHNPRHNLFSELLPAAKRMLRQPR